MLSVHTRRLLVLFVGAFALAGMFLGPAVESARADIIQNITVNGTATVAFADQTSPIAPLAPWVLSDYFGDLNDPDTIPPFVDILGSTLSISASGEWGHGPSPEQLSGPEGRGVKDAGTLLQYEAFGISIINNVDLNTLVGVFTNDAGPIPGMAPLRLTGGVSDMTTPLLNQTFAIGAALSDVDVPSGATRLYFGLHNGYEWTNNVGSVNVTVTQVPEPGILILLGISMMSVAGLRRLWKE